jgi:hypothetical protein
LHAMADRRRMQRQHRRRAAVKANAGALNRTAKGPLLRASATRDCRPL